MGGAITTNSTFDGRDVSVDGTKLDTIEVSATADQTDVEIRAAVESASDSNVFTNADHSKLDAIEALADVTDATNVTAAGALMDSEVTNLAQVKAFDSSDYATAAQGTTANAALPKAGGTMTGALNVNVTGSDVDAVTITGDNVTDFDFVANPPEFNLEDNSSTSGSKRARITVNSNQFQISALPDDDSSVSQYLFYGNLNNGNVGIGIDTPYAQLQVLDELKISNANQSSGKLVLGDGSSTNFNVGIARWNGTSNAAGAGGLGYFSQGTVNSGGHYFYNGDAVAGSTTEVMRINPDGMTEMSATKAYGSDLGLLRIRPSFTGTNYSAGAKINLVFGHETTANSYIGELRVTQSDPSVSTASTMGFYTNSGGGNSATTARMTISSAGKVGIGTANPNATLDVHESGITVSANQAFVANFIGNGYSTGQVFIGDSASVAADIGGELQFGGKYNSNSLTEWASVGGYKENATSGQYGGYFAIKTRAHGGTQTEKMRITADGKVAINHGLGGGAINSQFNVFADGEAIRLDGTANTSRTLRFRNVSTANPGIITADGSLEIGTEDANTSIGLLSMRDITYKTTKTNSTAGHHKFFSHNTEIMRIDGQNNRVGIGTDAPSVNLEVIDPVSGNFAGAITVGGNGSNRRLILEQTDVLTYRMGGTGTNSITQLVSAGSAGTGTVAMTIDESQNVGIGTANPSRLQYGSVDPKLHVDQGWVTGSYNLTARFSAGGDADNTGASILINHANDRGLLIEAGREILDTGIAHFGIVNSGGTNTRLMTLKQGGNVGIGTTTPHAKLAFGGSGQIWVNNDPSNPFGIDTAPGELRLFTGNANSYQMKFGKMATDGTTFTSHLTIGDDGSNRGNVGIGLDSPNTKLVIQEVPATIVGGNAISGSTMKGIKLQTTLNGDESVGLWFGTNSGTHWSGISGQRTTNSAGTAVDGWATDLRFYTHEQASADLTYARERMRIDSAGIVTKPYQPAFRAAGNGSWQTLGGNVQAPFNIAVVNTGGHYSAANKRFTAPVAGNYYFAWHTYNDSDL